MLGFVVERKKYEVPKCKQNPWKDILKPKFLFSNYINGLYSVKNSFPLLLKVHFVLFTELLNSLCNCFMQNVTVLHSFHVFIFFLGRTEPRQAQLGTPEWRFTRTYHCGGCSEQSRNKTEEGCWGSKKVTDTCSKYLYASLRFPFPVENTEIQLIMQR